MSAMEYEKDYIMRLIKQIIQVLMEVIFNKDLSTYEMPSENEDLKGDSLLARVIALADRGDINNAENILLGEVESGSQEVYGTAILFYDHLNNYDDDFLIQHDFSREEIKQGLRDIAKSMGYLSLIDALMDGGY